MAPLILSHDFDNGVIPACSHFNSFLDLAVEGFGSKWAVPDLAVVDLAVMQGDQPAAVTVVSR